MSTTTISWEPLKPHPFSKMFEKQDAEAVNTLAAFMKEHGFLQDKAIMTFQGMILDGNTRQAAAKKAGVTPIYSEFHGTEEQALNYVEAEIMRRSLNKTQRAVAAVHATKLRNKLPKTEASTENGKPLTQPLTQAQAAAKFKVSPRAVQQAADVLKTATEEEVEDLKSGKTTVGKLAKAKKIAKPKKETKKPTMKGEPMHDALGVEIPVLLRDVFGDTWLHNLQNQVDVWCAQLGNPDIAKDLEKRTKDFAGYLHGSMARNTFGKALDYLLQLQQMIKAAVPHCVCTACQGKGCSDCKHAGWMPEWRKEEIDAILGK
jgi:ParB-like chromosome segregation protein Spo0J